MNLRIKFLFILPFLILIFLFGSKFFLHNKSIIGYSISGTLRFLGGKLFNFPEYSAQGRRLADLIDENELLKTKIFDLQNRPETYKLNEETFLKAIVFSSYPFNNKSYLEINAGLKDGIDKGMQVFFNQTYLIGEIEEAYDNLSVVKTILDPKWNMSVKIGQDKTDAFYVGGRSPKLTLIPKNSNILSGDTIYSTSKLYKYGAKIGNVGNIFDVEGSGSKEAEIFFSYDISLINDFQILIK